MVSSILRIGDKLDIRVLQQTENHMQGGAPPRVLKSMIYDIKSEGVVEIAMPTEGAKMIMLASGIRYEIVFYAKSGMYRCIGQVKERYKSDNLYVVTMELKSGLSKKQRREFYRYECLLDIDYLPITLEESKMGNPQEMLTHHLETYQDDKILSGIAVDISGGGIRFVSKHPMDQNSYVLLHLHLESKSVDQDVWVKGRVLQEKMLENSPTKYEHRVQFELRNNRLREQIIKYIFEEERVSRKHEKG